MFIQIGNKHGLFIFLDVGMQLNNGKFELNNRTGYILKPEKLRSSLRMNSFNPYTQAQIDGVVCLKMNIKVSLEMLLFMRLLVSIFLRNIKKVKSGIFLDLNESKRLGDYITLEIYGLPNDCAIGPKSYRVNASTRRNFNVIYLDEHGFEISRVSKY